LRVSAIVRTLYREMMFNPKNTAAVYAEDDAAVHPKDDAAKAESLRLTKLFKWLMRLPLPCLLFSCAWIKHLFVRHQSPADERMAEKAHQSGIRRRLRGLPAVHDAAKPIP
jgi:hypothetical protein